MGSWWLVICGWLSWSWELELEGGWFLVSRCGYRFGHKELHFVAKTKSSYRELINTCEQLSISCVLTPNPYRFRTSQYPFLSAPTRRISPAICNAFILRAIELGDICNRSASSA